LNVIEKKISCIHPHPNYQKYLEINFPKDDEILNTSWKKGIELSKKVNANSPSGIFRDIDERIAANARGALSEAVSKLVLEERISSQNITALVEESGELIETPEGITQIDLAITINDKERKIETRSSCVRNGTEFGITSGYFNIVGWYSTFSKPGEPPKDYYLMHLFPFDASKTLLKFENGLTMHFVGGATKEMLEGSLGSTKSMKQTGASYRGITPICAGMDSLQIINAVLQ